MESKLGSHVWHIDPGYSIHGFGMIPTELDMFFFRFWSSIYLIDFFIWSFMIYFYLLFTKLSRFQTNIYFRVSTRFTGLTWFPPNLICFFFKILVLNLFNWFFYLIFYDLFLFVFYKVIRISNKYLFYGYYLIFRVSIFLSYN